MINIAQQLAQIIPFNEKKKKLSEIINNVEHFQWYTMSQVYAQTLVFG